jgi:hypothetical protein
MMETDDIQLHRRERLAAARDKAGGNAALGRLLGYLDGSYVGQMLRGERPIKEDTVAKLESKPGFNSWFDSPVPATPAMLFRDLSAFEAQLVTLFRKLPPDEQREHLTLLGKTVDKAGAPASVLNPWASGRRTENRPITNERRRPPATPFDGGPTPPPGRPTRPKQDMGLMLGSVGKRKARSPHGKLTTQPKRGKQ